MDGLTRILTKCAGGADPQAQALQTAAQMAKGPAGIALPTMPDKPEDPVVDDKALQAANKEIDSKKKEIDNLRNQLSAAKLDATKIQIKAELANEQTKMRESLQKEQTQMYEKLRQEQKELDKRQLEFKMEEAQHKSNMAAAESAHQAKLDKSVAAHDVQIAENKAKSLVDLANQSAKQYSSMIEQARKHSDAYFADRAKQYDASRPAINPALQNRIDDSLNAISRLKTTQDPFSKVSHSLPPEVEARNKFLWENPNVNYVDPDTAGLKNTLRPLRDYLLNRHPDDPNYINEHAIVRAKLQAMRRNLAHAGTSIGNTRAYADLINDIMQSGDYQAASALRTLIDLANPEEDDAAGIANQHKYYKELEKELASMERDMDRKISLYSGQNRKTMQNGGPEADIARRAQATYDMKSQRSIDADAAFGNGIQRFFGWRPTYNEEMPSYYDRMADNDMGKLDENSVPKSDNPPPTFNLFGHKIGLDALGLRDVIESHINYGDTERRRDALGIGHLDLAENGQLIDERTGAAASDTDAAIAQDFVNITGEYPTLAPYRNAVWRAYGNAALNTALWTGLSPSAKVVGKAAGPLTKNVVSWARGPLQRALPIAGAFAEYDAVSKALNGGFDRWQNNYIDNWYKPQGADQQQSQAPSTGQQPTAYQSTMNAQSRYIPPQQVTRKPVNYASTTPPQLGRSYTPSANRLATNTSSGALRSGTSTYSTPSSKSNSHLKQAAAGTSTPEANDFNYRSGWKHSENVRSSTDSLRAIMKENPVLNLLSGFIPQNFLSPNTPLMHNKYPAWDSNKIAMNYSNLFRKFSEPSSPLSAQLTQQYAMRHGLLI